MANKHTLVISTVDDQNKINQKSITNVSPFATKLEMRTFAEKLAALTDDTYVSSATVTRNELTAGTRPIVPCKVIITTQPSSILAMNQGKTVVDIADILSYPGVLTGSTFTEKTMTYRNISYNYYDAALRISKNNTDLVYPYGTYTRDGKDYQRILSRFHFYGENLQLWSTDESGISCCHNDSWNIILPNDACYLMDPTKPVNASLLLLWESPSSCNNCVFVVKDFYNEYAPVQFKITFVDE